METKNFFKSKTFTWVLVGIGELVILLLVFRAGMLVGFNKANFSFNWGENYQTLFAGHGPGGPGMMGGGPGRGVRDFINQFDKDDFIPGHSVVGSVIQVRTSTVLVKASDNTEKSLLITSGTSIRSGRQNLSIKDIKENDHVVALGSPSSSGQIEVKFMRVFPQ